MKHFLLTTITFLAVTITCKAQWTTPATGVVATTNLVGIGINSPSFPLDITLNAGGSPLLRLYNRDSVDGRSTINFSSGIGQNWEFGANPGGGVASFGIRDLTTSGFPIRFIVRSSGNVGIGTTNPDAKLTVNGTVHSTSVLVDQTIQGPDYVFKKDYNLPTLTEIKAYTDKNHHLPGVPAAAEMEKNGINLGEMNMVLLKKVEELTLYLMEQNKQLQAQQKEIELLKKKK